MARANAVSLSRWFGGMFAIGLLVYVLVGGASNSAEAIDADEVTTVYVADGTNYADALMGATLATSNNSPMLGVAPGVIPQETERELDRLTDGKTNLLDEIVVFGGPAAVSSEVFEQLGQWASNVRRIEGANRWGTYEAISQALPNAVTEAEHAVEADRAVTSGDADTVDGHDATAFAVAGHHHVALFDSATDDGLVETSSTTWQDATGMSTQVTVPPGRTGVIVARFFAHSACTTSGSSGGVCRARIVRDGSPLSSPYHSFDADVDGLGFEAHGIQRITGELDPGTYTLTVQLQVSDLDTGFLTYNRSLTAEVKLTS